MAQIVHFVSRAELDAEQNLKGFVDVCRNQLTVFGADLDFSANVWNVTAALEVKRAVRQSLVFSTWKTVRDSPWAAMSEPFLSFAKAYMRYQHAHRPTKCHGHRLAALRVLEAALSENGGPADPVLVTPQALNRASQLCVKKYTKSAAHRVCGQLEMINTFMIRNRLVAVPSRWRNPTTRPKDTVRVGPEFDRLREKKLPSPAALSAAASIFHLATEPGDILVTSIVAILCAAPSRISEVLYLRENCEVTHIVPSTGKETYGLRWYPAKDAPPMIKWIIPAMADVVREAVAKIRKITAPAREIAKWYETHPTEIYLPRHLEHVRGCEWITLDEAGEIVFLDPVIRGTVSVWCDRNGVARSKGRAEQPRCRMADVRAAVLSSLPREFPWAHRTDGLKFSDALFVVRPNLMSEGKAGLRGTIELITHAEVRNRLSGRDARGTSSIFERHGFSEEDGSGIRITTHQFRHYLNTLAQAGGLSQLDIAKWSGRKDIKQNRAYDHLSDRDVVAMVRTAVGDPERAVGPLARVDSATLIRRDEFASLKVPTAHTTEFGFCIHDFSMLPCQLHRDCLNCTEQVCIKGDEVRERNIRRLRDETRQLLAEAVTAESDKYHGASRWVEHQRRTLARLEELCTIFDDPSIPRGTVIQPTKAAPASRVEQAGGDRALCTTSVRAPRALSSPTRGLQTPGPVEKTGADA